MRMKKLRPKIFFVAYSWKLPVLPFSGNFDIYIPINESKTNRNIGRGETFPFGRNVIEVQADEVKDMEFDCILFQTKENYLYDQYELLSASQQQLPWIYLEHDPPYIHPTDTKHIVDDPEVLVVHVTHFNKLMWNNNRSRTIVIEHGVTSPKTDYQGHIQAGIVVINNLPSGEDYLDWTFLIKYVNMCL